MSDFAEILNSTRVPSEFPITSSGIAFVAEAPGETEIQEGRPLIGSSGQEFNALLHSAGILRSECFVGNVFGFRLPENKLATICAPKSEMPVGYALPAADRGLYVRPEFLLELDRLRDELAVFKPTVIVPLGNTALWAVCGISPAIGQARGYVRQATIYPCKALPTFHPAHVLRAYDTRATVLADLLKAKRQAKFPEIRRPLRKVWISPTIEDLSLFEYQYLRDCTLLSVDIETKRPNIISCIGFATSSHEAIVVPFYDESKPTRSYWSTFEEEREAYRWCRRILKSPVPKLFQNGLYDMFWLRRVFHIDVRNAQEDTQILHHAIQPELPKSLHFLGSVYTDEVAWKLERPRGSKTEDKDD